MIDHALLQPRPVLHLVEVHRYILIPRRRFYEVRALGISVLVMHPCGIPEIAELVADAVSLGVAEAGAVVTVGDVQKLAVQDRGLCHRLTHLYHPVGLFTAVCIGHRVLVMIDGLLQIPGAAAVGELSLLAVRVLDLREPAGTVAIQNLPPVRQSDLAQ